MSSGGQFIIVTEYFEHELYNEFELTHDVAILKLSANLVFSTSVRAIIYHHQILSCHMIALQQSVDGEL